MIKFKDFLLAKEDVVGGTATPANAMGSGAIAGGGGIDGEPGVNKKKKKTPVIDKLLKRQLPK